MEYKFNSFEECVRFAIQQCIWQYLEYMERLNEQLLAKIQKSIALGYISFLYPNFYADKVFEAMLNAHVVTKQIKGNDFNVVSDVNFHLSLPQTAQKMVVNPDAGK